MKKWNVEQRRRVLQARVFTYHQHTCANVDGTKRGVYDVLECHDWANIVAVTADQKMLLVRQYRFGVDELTLETPAGVIHHDEDPLMAAQRELREECGYISSRWVRMGEVASNPAFMTNNCHYFLALDAVYEGEQQLDPDEEIEVELVPVEEALELARTGKINHSIALAALSLFQLNRERYL